MCVLFGSFGASSWSLYFLHLPCCGSILPRLSKSVIRPSNSLDRVSAPYFSRRNESLSITCPLHVFLAECCASLVQEFVCAGLLLWYGAKLIVTDSSVRLFLRFFLLLPIASSRLRHRSPPYIVYSIYHTYIIASGVVVRHHHRASSIATIDAMISSNSTDDRAHTQAHETDESKREQKYTGGTVITVFFALIIGSMALGQISPAMEAIGNGQGAAQKIFEVCHTAVILSPLLLPSLSS